MTAKSTPFAAFMASATELGAHVPEWVMLVPPGELVTQDGQSGFRWDGSLVKLCSWDGKDTTKRAPVDVNHANSKLGPQGGDSPAHGWIVELSVREGGLWARIDWNESGKQLLANRSYRGISAELMVNPRTGLIMGIRGASLTNHPNLKGLKPILNSTGARFIETENDENMDKLLAILCASLSLKADAGEDAVVAAVNTLVSDHKTKADQLVKLCAAAGVDAKATFEVQMQAVSDLRDPAKVVPLSVVEGLRAELMTVTNKLNGLEGAGAKARAEAFVDAAIKAGHVGVKPLREHYVARHMSSAAEAANVEKEIGSLPKVQGGSILPASPPEGGSAALMSAEDQAVAKAMGVDPEDMKKIRAAEAANKEAV